MKTIVDSMKLKLNLFGRVKPLPKEKDNSEKGSYSGYDDRTLLYPVGHKFAWANGIAATPKTAANWAVRFGGWIKRHLLREGDSASRSNIAAKVGGQVGRESDGQVHGDSVSDIPEVYRDGSTVGQREMHGGSQLVK